MTLQSARPIVSTLPARRVRQVPFGIADLFKIGIGPSSSHTVGPMRAAATFRGQLEDEAEAWHDGRWQVERVTVTLHGSLAWTGRGHATDRAVVLGLAGEWPNTIDPDRADAIVDAIGAAKRLELTKGRSLAFDPAVDIAFDFGPPLSRHPNALTFAALDHEGVPLLRETWFSVGGGFIEREGDVSDEGPTLGAPHAYASAADLLALTRAGGLTIAAVALANETRYRPQADTLALLDATARAMDESVERGLARTGVLPGGLQVRRRAAAIYARLTANPLRNDRLPHEAMDHVSVFAMAVNEENAAGGRVVTAPTNGAAGVIPAILRYHRVFCGGDAASARTILLTASVIGDLIKRKASISGAEVGCQGEVGSAAAMAAAGLCAALGGTVPQVLNAAEIGLEHHLGMTCDPLGGLVQVPCIERNGFGAIKAISAASLALHGDGTHMVSLDQVIETMRQTGLDMKAEYRETSRGGLAVNVPAC